LVAMRQKRREAIPSLYFDRPYLKTARRAK
jgi:hypothetical protein